MNDKMQLAIAVASERFKTQAHPRVLVRRYQWSTFGQRHLSLKSDENGLYVLIGRRQSQQKKYLDEMAHAFVAGASTPVFCES